MSMSPVTTVLIVSLVIATFSSISCICERNFITICDSFKDVSKIDTKELIIGSTHSRGYKNKLTSANLYRVITSELKNVNVLMILRRINRLRKSTSKVKKFPFIHLDMLFFYGNEMKKIEVSQFPPIWIKKLSLVNNKIEEIEEGAFRNCKIVHFDVSQNKLAFIKKKMFPKLVTRTITAKDNKLELIEPRSFSSRLETLNLDGNQLRTLNFLENLLNLEELTLSRNQISVVANITHLEKLKILDLSSNKITFIESRSIKSMNLLRLVNLGLNKISNATILKYLPTFNDSHTLVISFALNRLKNVSLDDLRSKNVVFVRYGNLWDCGSCKVLSRELVSKESKCSLKYYSNGAMPYCINYSLLKTSNLKSELETVITKYHGYIKNTMNNVSCNILLNRDLLG